ncbi:class I SAM-dependent methyltransferase [Glaciihabitans arcticus]|uniref:Class I SAM-dependent methyltransferase n=1 Tax=Glaciihabitans arcticus TaxID=2668039 RepID=A0A4Q9GR86_9MICO|nr:class I SAM-dependent methyltransferase [Glaciihabitans arcticus]TBN57446.1 class I SAM-dependent methyltransferase [Glaciihabitans arcticus]
MTDTMDANAVLKQKHRAMWALGNYPELATDIIADLGPRLVAAANVKSGDRVLDVAAGAGNAAIPAAMRGADVIASDLTPELLEVGKREAQMHGVTLDWQTADAEALPFDTASFDVTMSCVGVMFAPHHQATADELLRVTRPGGTIAVLNWTPQGFVGQMFATMKPYAAPPAPGAQPPPLWGDEAHVRELFGDAVRDVTARLDTVRISHFGSPEEFRDYFKSHYGPTIACYRNIGDDPERVAALDAELVALGERFAAASTDSGDAGSGTGFEMGWEYLLVTATRA